VGQGCTGDLTNLGSFTNDELRQKDEYRGDIIGLNPIMLPFGELT